MRTWSSIRCPILLMVVVTMLSPGCKLLQIMKGTHVPPTERIPVETVKTAGKNLIPEPDLDTFRLAPYVFYADFKIDRNHAVFKDLANLRNQVYDELNLPSTDRHVHVYLFKDEERYHQFIEQRYTLPRRRAYFISKPEGMMGEEKLMVFTTWSDRIEQDLRHELTHALLHSVLQNVPIWLDEGLAEYFELPPHQKGINETHLRYLYRSVVFKPDMDQLEKLHEVWDMGPPQYRESWAWVHLMLRGEPRARKVLLQYLYELRTNANPRPLGPRLDKVMPERDQRLTRHIHNLREQSRLAKKR